MCACFYEPKFYDVHAAKLAKAARKPMSQVDKQPHCVYGACATSTMQHTDAKVCPDQIEQKCVKRLSRGPGVRTYFGDTTQLAQCIMETKYPCTVLEIATPPPPTLTPRAAAAARPAAPPPRLLRHHWERLKD